MGKNHNTYVFVSLGKRHYTYKYISKLFHLNAYREKK